MATVDSMSINQFTQEHNNSLDDDKGYDWDTVKIERPHQGVQ